MNSEFVVEWCADLEQALMTNRTFEHLHEALDFVSIMMCKGIEVTVTPYWRRAA